MTTYQHPQLDALGDGTRRAILAKLLAEGPLAVGDIARAVPVSRPAVSQHLQVLKRARLVTDQRAGTRRMYGLDPQGFEHVRAYFDQFWAVALSAFQRAVEARRDKEPR